MVTIPTNYTSSFYNDTLTSFLEAGSQCPRQRSITRPLLFVHNYSLFFFGSILNFLAFIILIQRPLRCNSTFAYLAFLSLSNGLLSLVHFSKWMFHYYFNIAFENYLITCRLQRFLSDFLTHFSLFTLICVNIDRARTVARNHPSRRYARSKFQMVLMKESLVASILCVFHFHWIVKYGYEVTDEDTKIALCGFHHNQSTTFYYYFLTTIYPPFELVVFFCLPLLINIFCTMLILRSLSVRMRTAKRFRPTAASFQEKPIERTNSNGFLSYFLPKTASKSEIHVCFCFQMQCRRHTRMRLKIGRTKQSLLKYDEENQVIDRQISLKSTTDNRPQSSITSTTNILNKSHRTRRTRDINLSAMLISLNIVYLLLNLPFNLHQTFVKHFHHEDSDRCNIMFVSLLLDTLQQTYFSTNFFLYVLTNRRFREDFYNTISKISSHCRQQSSNKRNSFCQQPSRMRSSSFNVLTNVRLNSISDNQIIFAGASGNHESFVSEIELAPPPTMIQQQPQQTVAVFHDNNKASAKLVVFKDVSNNQS